MPVRVPTYLGIGHGFGHRCFYFVLDLFDLSLHLYDLLFESVLALGYAFGSFDLHYGQPAVDLFH